MTSCKKREKRELVDCWVLACLESEVEHSFYRQGSKIGYKTDDSYHMTVRETVGLDCAEHMHINITGACLPYFFLHNAKDWIGGQYAWNHTLFVVQVVFLFRKPKQSFFIKSQNNTSTRCTNVVGIYDFFHIPVTYI